MHLLLVSLLFGTKLINQLLLSSEPSLLISMVLGQSLSKLSLMLDAVLLSDLLMPFHQVSNLFLGLCVALGKQLISCLHVSSVTLLLLQGHLIPQHFGIDMLFVQFRHFCEVGISCALMVQLHLFLLRLVSFQLSGQVAALLLNHAAQVVHCLVVFLLGGLVVLALLVVLSGLFSEVGLLLVDVGLEFRA